MQRCYAYFLGFLGLLMSHPRMGKMEISIQKTDKIRFDIDKIQFNMKMKILEKVLI
jgi:hypothetical protein